MALCRATALPPSSVVRGRRSGAAIAIPQGHRSSGAASAAPFMRRRHIQTIAIHDYLLQQIGAKHFCANRRTRRIPGTKFHETATDVDYPLPDTGLRTSSNIPRQHRKTDQSSPVIS